MAGMDVDHVGAGPDDFYSGTFQSAGLRIGYIRIPSFSPLSATTATTAFRSEIAFFEQNRVHVLAWSVVRFWA